MKLAYRVEYKHEPILVEVQVEKENETSVTVRGVVYPKQDYRAKRFFFDNWFEARRFLVGRMNMAMEAARVSVVEAERNVQKAQSLEPPQHVVATQVEQDCQYAGKLGDADD